MIKRSTQRKFRKVHRYLGLFLGLQFLMWTISGIYFSWTNLDEIHGDHFRTASLAPVGFTQLDGPSLQQLQEPVHSLELLEIAEEPYYWVNENQLVHALSGEHREGISEAEALAVAARYMREDLVVNGVERIETAGAHHEYRGRPLPAYVISYEGAEEIRCYVAAANGEFQTLRHRDWRWFDFLWMTHTMDYQGRDNFNTLLLRAFSLLGLVTVLSGFALWAVSSPSLRSVFK